MASYCSGLKCLFDNNRANSAKILNIVKKKNPFFYSIILKQQVGVCLNGIRTIVIKTGVNVFFFFFIPFCVQIKYRRTNCAGDTCKPRENHIRSFADEARNDIDKQ